MSYFAPYIDSKGVHMPTYEDRLAELTETYKSIYGSSAELSESVPDYQLLSVFAKSLDDVSALTLQAYNARNPMYATGAALDLLLPQYGLTREEGESDASVRGRIRQFLASGSRDPIGKIMDALRELQYFRRGKIFLNESDTTNADGIPPHSIALVEQGGYADQLAQAIFDNKPPGISTYGSTTADAVDADGNTHPISFSRSQPKFIYVSLFIDTINGGDQTAIQEAIVPALVSFINTRGINGTLNVPQLYGVAYASDPAIADTFLIRDIQVSVPGASSITRDVVTTEWNEECIALNSGGTIQILWNYGH